jgi:peptide/nickel transport system permease protein
MRTTSDIDFLQAIQNAQDALQHKDLRSTRYWAQLAVTLAPEREEPWLLLAAVADPRASLGYINQALKINPESERALNGRLWAQKRIEATRQKAATAPHRFSRQEKPAQNLPDSTPSINVPKSQSAVEVKTGQMKNNALQVQSLLLALNSPFMQFTVRRFLTIPFSLLIITMLLFAGVMLTPVETRARLYLPPEKGGQNSSEQVVKNYIVKYHLAEPYLVQYAWWIKSLVQGDWGYSPVFNGAVLPALLLRTPATAELALYSLLLFIPFGLMSGVASGWKQRQTSDNLFRFSAFLFTSLPPFVLGLILISFFYVGLNWFAPERLSNMLSYKLDSQNFRLITGMYTFDGVLNGRLDVTIDAFRHLAMPAITLALYHWATLGRITRAAMIAEKNKEYVIAAKARGIREHNLVWKHLFRNTLAPSFTSLGLSAASLVTGVFVVEIIFSYQGISDLIVKSMQGTPDAAAALGFSVYSAIMVLLLMFVLDVIQAAIDPRVRNEVLRS